MYKKLRNYSNHEDRRLKSEHFRNLIEENKSDSNQMWKALKQTLPSKNCSEVKAIKVKKKIFHHPREIAEALNKHFSTIGQKLANAMCPSGEEVLVEPKSKSKFSLNHVSTEFVTRQLRGLKTNKAAGLDKISARLLKDSADIISPVLQYLINLSIDQNSFPNSWKSAKVVARSSKTVTAVTVTIIGPFLSFPLQARFSNVLFTRSFMLIWRAKNFFLCASLDSVNRYPRPMPC